MFKSLTAWLRARAAWGVRNQFLTQRLTPEEARIVIDLCTVWGVIYDRSFKDYQPPPDLLYVISGFFARHVADVQKAVIDGLYPGVAVEWVRMLAYGAIMLDGRVTRPELQAVILRALSIPTERP